MSDLVATASWYQRVLGYQLVMEFVEGNRLVGLGLSHPEGGTQLTLRLDPARAGTDFTYFEMGVPDRQGMQNLLDHLDHIGEPHGPIVRTPIGWLLPGLIDPDGFEVRFYTTDLDNPDITTNHPVRIHDAGPNGWMERLSSPLRPLNDSNERS